MSEKVDLIVVGSGLCGLAIASTAAQRGLKVRCVGDGQPGASLANFGQLHSGAIFAPVLPDVAKACWTYRDQWNEIAPRARIAAPYGYGLFSSPEAAETYQRAWQSIGITAAEIDPDDADLQDACPRPTAAFRLPDFSVDLEHLYELTVARALASGVPPVLTQHVTLQRDPASGQIILDEDIPAADTIVLATGSGTPAILEDAGISHTLNNRRIPWGELTGHTPTHLTYWLDDDLLGFAPTRTGALAGQPGPRTGYGSDEEETQRLRAALNRHRIEYAPNELTLRWGLACEPTAAHADPTCFVADLRQPPQGWDQVDNLVVAIPGKWVTAWQCADRVVDTIV